MVSFEQALGGIVKFIDKEMMPGMVDWQKFIVRTAVSRVYRNKEGLKQLLCKNGFILSFGIMDENGNLDTSGLASDLKEGIGGSKMEFQIPLLGKYTFYQADIDRLVQYMEGIA